MNFVLVGVNHKMAPVRVREKMSLDATLSQNMLKKLMACPEIEEATVLSTCNRVEFYSATQDPVLARKTLSKLLGEPLEQGCADELFYCKEDEEAVSHLFEVTASLDSQVTGENQITGQVKDAYQSALERSATGFYLNKLFDRALFVAKRVKSETQIGKGNVSVGSVGVLLARKIFGDLSGKSVLLLGAGEIGELVLRHLNSESLAERFIVNRTFEKAKVLEREGLGTAVEVEQLGDLLTQMDVLITSVSSDVPELSKSSLENLMIKRNQRPLFIIDLGVPRNVREDVSHISNLYVYNMDDLKEVALENQKGRFDAMADAKNIIDQEVKLFYEKHLEFNALPAIAQLGKKFEQVRQKELKRTLDRLGHLEGADHKAIDKLTQALVNRILHDPILSLRSQKEMAEPAMLSIFKRLFKLDDED